MKKFIVLLLLTLSFTIVKSQEQTQHIGLGLGVDYGGFGMRYTYLPAPSFGIFGSLGYNLASAGYNFGMQYKFPSKSRASVYLIGMYGYNGVIVISGSITSKSVYYGPTFGVGVEARNKNNEANFWNFELLVPIRSSGFQNEIDYWKSRGVSITSPLPIGISIGYHFGF